MDKLMSPIGMWCKRGAWFIAVVGLLGVVVEVYLFVHASGGAPWSSILVQLLPLVLSIVPTFIFYSLILYAVGVIIDRFLVYTAGNSTKAKVGGVMLDEVEETAIEPAMVDAQEIGDLRQDRVEDVIAPSTTAEVAEEISSMTQDRVEDVIAPSTTAEVAEEISSMTQDRVEDVIAPSTTAEVAEEESNMTQDKVEDVTVPLTMVGAAEEESSMTQDKVEDVIPPLTMVEAAEEESSMTQDKVEDVTAPLTMVGAAEEESNMTLTNEEASPIKPTTVESNGKNRDMKLARRRQRR